MPSQIFKDAIEDEGDKGTIETCGVFAAGCAVTDTSTLVLLYTMHLIFHSKLEKPLMAKPSSINLGLRGCFGF